jgi:hypothetical protein
MKARIKVGALISQDFASGHWPATRSGDDVDPDMKFSVEWKGTYWDCKAPGYGYMRSRGEQGDYGNGSIFVHEKDGIVMVPNDGGKQRHETL